MIFKALFTFIAKCLFNNFETQRHRDHGENFSVTSVISVPLCFKLIICHLLFVLLLSSCSDSTPKLHIYIWGDFIKQETIEAFEEKYNCKVIVDTYDSNESMYAKLKSGASGYDLIFPSGYILQAMTAQKMLYTIDKTLIPSLKNLDLTYLDLLNEPHYENSVPYAITFSAIAYRQDKVKDPDPSWNVFKNSKLKGRMTMLNDMREVMGAALRTLGFSVNTTKAQEINEAAELVAAWKKNLAKFESEQYKNGIASAEYLLVQGYSSDIWQIIEEDPDVALLLPSEGSIFSCDYVAIPKDAPSIMLAHAFINFLLEPTIAANNMAANFYLSPNSSSFELLSEELLQNPAIFPPIWFVEKSESVRDIGPDIRLYIDAWDRIKMSR